MHTPEEEHGSKSVDLIGRLQSWNFLTSTSPCESAYPELIPYVELGVTTAYAYHLNILHAHHRLTVSPIQSPSKTSLTHSKYIYVVLKFV